MLSKILFVLILLFESKTHEKPVSCENMPLTLNSQVFKHSSSKLRVKLTLNCPHDYSFHSVFIALPKDEPSFTIAKPSLKEAGLLYLKGKAHEYSQIGIIPETPMDAAIFLQQTSSDKTEFQFYIRSAGKPFKGKNSEIKIAVALVHPTEAPKMLYSTIALKHGKKVAQTVSPQIKNVVLPLQANVEDDDDDAQPIYSFSGMVLAEGEKTAISTSSQPASSVSLKPVAGCSVDVIVNASFLISTVTDNAGRFTVSISEETLGLTDGAERSVLIRATDFSDSKAPISQIKEVKVPKASKGKDLSIQPFVVLSLPSSQKDAAEAHSRPLQATPCTTEAVTVSLCYSCAADECTTFPAGTAPTTQIAGRTVTLTRTDGTADDPTDYTETTTADGVASFAAVCVGTYTLNINGVGDEPNTTETITVAANDSNDLQVYLTNATFCVSTVSGVVCLDCEGTGACTNESEGISGATVQVLSAAGPNNTFTTGTNGEFTFNVTSPFTGTLNVTVPCAADENGTSPQNFSVDLTDLEPLTNYTESFPVECYDDCYVAPTVNFTVSFCLDCAENGSCNPTGDDAAGAFDGLNVVLTTPTNGTANITSVAIAPITDDAADLENVTIGEYDLYISPYPTTNDTGLHYVRRINVTEDMGEEPEDLQDIPVFKRDACLEPPVIQGTVCYDCYQNGTCTLPAANLTVTAFNYDTNETFNATTDEQGRFNLTVNSSGIYNVSVEIALCNNTEEETGDDEARGADSVNITVNLNSTVTRNYTVDLHPFCNSQCYTPVFGCVYCDLYQNGTNETCNGEGFPDVRIEIFDEDGTSVAETTTDEDGVYTFDGILPGNYTIVAYDVPDCSELPSLRGLVAQTLTRNVTITGGEPYINASFAVYETNLPGFISGFVRVRATINTSNSSAIPVSLNNLNCACSGNGTYPPVPPPPPCGFGGPINSSIGFDDFWREWLERNGWNQTGPSQNASDPVFPPNPPPRPPCGCARRRREREQAEADNNQQQTTIITTTTTSTRGAPRTRTVTPTAAPESNVRVLKAKNQFGMPFVSPALDSFFWPPPPSPCPPPRPPTPYPPIPPRPSPGNCTCAGNVTINATINLTIPASGGNATLYRDDDGTGNVVNGTQTVPLVGGAFNFTDLRPGTGYRLNISLPEGTVVDIDDSVIPDSMLPVLEVTNPGEPVQVVFGPMTINDTTGEGIEGLLLSVVSDELTVGVDAVIVDATISGVSANNTNSTNTTIPGNTTGLVSRSYVKPNKQTKRVEEPPKAKVQRINPKKTKIAKLKEAKAVKPQPAKTGPPKARVVKIANIRNSKHNRS